MLSHRLKSIHAVKTNLINSVEVSDPLVNGINAIILSTNGNNYTSIQGNKLIKKYGNNFNISHSLHCKQDMMQQHIQLI